MQISHTPSPIIIFFSQDAIVWVIFIILTRHSTTWRESPSSRRRLSACTKKTTVRTYSYSYNCTYVFVEFVFVFVYSLSLSCSLGILWKHVEYRNGHNESRRARELVLSSIATVVNYEYLFYWRLKLDGSIDFEIRLTGELSTNLPSASEDPDKPDHGILCSPGVNSQIHQHMFCARLDMNVDGDKNTVSEINVETAPSSPGNPYGNIFAATETRLNSEKEAVRMCDANKARLWKIANAEGAVNPITKKPTAYKLIPFTRGPAMPPLLTHPEECAVSKKSKFATAHLWVTQYDQKERYPAGEYPTQATAEQVKTAGGLPIWIENRNADLSKGSDVVLWHSFGVTHVPRVEGK